MNQQVSRPVLQTVTAGMMYHDPGTGVGVYLAVQALREDTVTDFDWFLTYPGSATQDPRPYRTFEAMRNAIWDHLENNPCVSPGVVY